MNKKSQVNTLNIIIGSLVVIGGLLFMINKTGYGLVAVSISLLIEAVKNLFK